MTPARITRARDQRLRRALEDARGESEFVIVVVADIRGFSEFSHRHESPDVAMYIKRVYMKLIDDYFPFATFYKATGDGLLMTVPYDERDLKEKVQATIQSCLRCVGEFAGICSGDPMVNFPTLDKIGFGVARGPACCLVSGRTVLDYSGHLLNLASRLMDLARPSGIVLDDAVGVELLDDDTRDLFEPQEVYVRSVAEVDPKTVYVLKGAVEIAEQATHPIRFEHWERIEVTQSVREWKLLAPQFRVVLPKGLKRADGVSVYLEHGKVRGGKPMPPFVTYHQCVDFRHDVLGNEDAVMLDTAEIVQYARSKKLRQDATLTAAVSYVPR
jgi:class 3 adenylate cyclase